MQTLQPVKICPLRNTFVRALGHGSRHTSWAQQGIENLVVQRVAETAFSVILFIACQHQSRASQDQIPPARLWLDESREKRNNAKNFSVDRSWRYSSYSVVRTVLSLHHPALF